MSTVSSETYSFTKISLSNKVTALDTTLKECLFNFKGLMLEVEQISNECESYKADFAMQKEKCENKSCSSSEVLKKVIESKETIIQLAAAAVTKLNETKNFNVVSEIFKILCGEVVTLTPPRDSQEQNRHEKIPLTDHPKTTANVKKKLLITPKKELNSQDVSIKDESICEIDGTPGRTSPIIHSKKLKSSSSVSSLSGSSDSRDKKKCPDSWSTPEPKQLKLSYTMTGKSGGKQRQMRLNFVNTKSASVVDLTSSPEFSGGVRSQNPHVQLIIKQESSENDDTILPSPTSGDGKFALFPRSPYKASPKKVPKYQSPLKKEPLTVIIKTETSLKPEKCLPKEQRPSNVENNDDDITHCEEASMSILRHVDSILDHAKEGLKSPTKRPLVENKNCVNTQSDHESSISLLRQEPTEKPIEDNAKRKATENVEPVYKEPTVRKKAEKLALPGWCCDECKAFFGDLYADDADKIKAVIARCSKHRGRNNPARPKTPPGIWNPRWHVPTDTDDFNRLNDAL
ncbi:uncharacterized protein LOC126371716 isoform X2 [Pectinophora gossypiella]|uniref:uncharacterized protein LOC126371716 isoform X2 n=1 Tax=Pectinophora gossypiella TaxID=13191 RepID=UPI00214EE469|nr:uncharacterized protein LOC126371716 isoform X2 [Pectinophora gossypiella]